MNPENRNMILAITLSMAVLFGWQMFVVGPELEKEAQIQQVIAEQEAAAAAASGDAPQVDPNAVAGGVGAAATGDPGERTIELAVQTLSEFGIGWAESAEAQPNSAKNGAAVLVFRKNWMFSESGFWVSL